MSTHLKPLKFANGDKVKDRISGLQGIVTATTIWLNGCVRYLVQPQGINKEKGEPIEGTSFDENDLILVKAAAVKNPFERIADPQDKPPGGPQRGEHATRRQT